MAKHIYLAAAVLGALGIASACTVHQATAPTTNGPSEFALSVDVTAQPDSINQDGGSQSSIRVMAHGPTGQPLSGQTVRLDTFVAGAQTDYGTLSARTVVTGSDGVARAIYTAPPAPPAGTIVGTCGSLAGSCVSIVATPAGTNFQSTQSQSVDIHLTPVGLILPPGDVPVPSFTASPAKLNLPTTFDASASCGSALVNGACNPAGPFPSTITLYSWSFGDGATGSGRTVSHTYTSAGTFAATLTATNTSLLSASTTQQITVTASDAPTGDWVFSPAAPVVNSNVVFNGDGVQPAPGRTLVSFSWNFGDGVTASGFQATHPFAAAGAYNVVFTVLDDAGQKKVISKTVTVGTGATASFSYAATLIAHQITVDGSASVASASATISTYAWSWGDGGSSAGSTSFATHTYALPSNTTVTVTLTVTDSLNRVGSTSQSVTVP